MDQGDDLIQLKKIVVLGATGTIGRMSLDVLKRLKTFEVVGMSANKNFKALLKAKKNFPTALTALTGVENGEVDFCGQDSIEKLLESTRPDQVVVGIAGFAGLKHALSASKYSKRLCLANKESVVAGGRFFIESVRKNGCEIIPVDSEHNAVFQLLDEEKSKVDSIILTASGGAVRDVPLKELKDVSPQTVLKHPIWAMGARITVDSATMFNKGFEVIEARFLFDFPIEKIKAVLHPQGKIHAMVELEDGTFKMHASKADMRIPISYALNYPKRVKLFDGFTPFGNVTFEKPDIERYPALYLAYEVLKSGDGARVAYNAADEVAVNAFLKSQIRFTDIYEVVLKVLQNEWPRTLKNYEEIEEVDKKSRILTKEMTNACY